MQLPQRYMPVTAFLSNLMLVWLYFQRVRLNKWWEHSEDCEIWITSSKSKGNGNSKYFLRYIDPHISIIRLAAKEWISNPISKATRSALQSETHLSPSKTPQKLPFTSAFSNSRANDNPNASTPKVNKPNFCMLSMDIRDNAMDFPRSSINPPVSRATSVFLSVPSLAVIVEPRTCRNCRAH